MHYKNQREAKEGDPVIVKTYSRVIAGNIHSLNPGCDSSNGQVSYPIPGGFSQACVTVGECWHAEDALAAAESTLQPAQSS